MSDLATSPPSVVRYAYKASLISSAQMYELDGDTLRWRIGGRSGAWPLRTIAAIRLSYRPVSMQSRRFRADIFNDRGERLTIFSTTWQTAALMQTQDTGYNALILALHRRLAAIDSRARFTAGLPPLLYRGGVFILAFVGLAIVAMVIRAAWIGLWVGGVFVIAFAALFAWQARAYMTRNRPRDYRPEQIPPELLPGG